MSIRQRVFAHKCIIFGCVLFGLAFIGTGLQHFIYLQFVATLVPIYMPAPTLCAGLTGAAMIITGLGLVFQRRPNLAVLLLSLMMIGFIAMIHIPKLIAAPHELNNWVRAVQDIAILGTAMMLTSIKPFNRAGIILYALPLILLGIAHFIHPGLIVPKIPAYLSTGNILDYIIGALMVAFGVCIIVRRYVQLTALALGTLLLLFAFLYSLPVLVQNIKNGGEWTNFLLAMAVAAGGFVVAGKATK